MRRSGPTPSPKERETGLEKRSILVRELVSLGYVVFPFRFSDYNMGHRIYGSFWTERGVGHPLQHKEAGLPATKSWEREFPTHPSSSVPRTMDLHSEYQCAILCWHLHVAIKSTYNVGHMVSAKFRATHQFSAVENSSSSIDSGSRQSYSCSLYQGESHLLDVCMNTGSCGILMEDCCVFPCVISVIQAVTCIKDNS